MFKFGIKNNYHKARAGFFNTPHGKIKTPNLAIVATHGKIKLLNRTDYLRANPDLLISNTFHLFVNNKVKEIKKLGGLHKWGGHKKPIMTDSGGFQVFSLGWGKVFGIGKVASFNSVDSSTGTGRPPTPAVGGGLGSRPADPDRGSGTKLVGAPRHSARRAGGILNRDSDIFQKISLSKNQTKISEKGVVFKYNDKKYELTPESSMKIQKDLGADIIFAFDECTSPLHNHDYTKKSMERTHRWAVRSLNAFNSPLKTHNSLLKSQALFGIVQGGIYEDLRKKSSKFIGALPFDGFGIGGSFGERQMEDVLGWALSGLSEEKPRHLLGIGKIKDIFIAVKQGIDLFDCVVPTREARHGVIYAKNGKLPIEKAIFSKDKKLIDRNCDCWVCREGIKRNELREYFKTDKVVGQRFATIHNIHFFKNLFEEIREAIGEGKLGELEKEYNSNF